jgi:UDP-N-acetyl-D-mannosaminuronic acid dehydrogenase
LALKYRGQISVVEPNIESIPANLGQLGVELTHLEQALEIGDVLILLVDHTEFREKTPLFSRNQKLIDARGIWKQKSI